RPCPVAGSPARGPSTRKLHVKTLIEPTWLSWTTLPRIPSRARDMPSASSRRYSTSRARRHDRGQPTLRQVSDAMRGAAAAQRLGSGALVGGGPTADRARQEVVPAGRAVLATEEDDLEVTVVPGLDRERRLQVTFDLLDVLAHRESPALGEAVDVGVDRERRDAERLRHHDAGGLVADTGEGLEELPVRQHLSPAIDDLVGGDPQVSRLGRSEPDLADDGEDPLRSELDHLLRGRGLGEQRRSDLV